MDRPKIISWRLHEEDEGTFRHAWKFTAPLSQALIHGVGWCDFNPVLQSILMPNGVYMPLSACASYVASGEVTQALQA